MSLIVQKYGGSSLATPRHIRLAAQRIKQVKKNGQDLVVIVSAMGRMTDHLIALARRTVAVPPQRELDMLMTAGERVSMSLLAMALHEEGVPAISFTGSQSGIVTTPHHTEARILEIRPHRTREELAKGKVVIVAGFQGVSEAKEITTLGRGGSDTSAVAMAAVLGAEWCEILTDVDGLFSADPRLVKGARLIESCSYDEALELASLGAKMHARSVDLAKRFRVNLRIASSTNLSCRGTELRENTEEEKMERTLIRGIAIREGYHFFHAETKLESLSEVLSDLRLHLRFFSDSQGAFRFACEKEKAPSVKLALEKLGIPFKETEKISAVSIVGNGLSSCSETLPQFLKILKASQTESLLLCANSLSLTALIPSEAKNRLAQALHETLIEAGPLEATLRSPEPNHSPST